MKKFLSDKQPDNSTFHLYGAMWVPRKCNALKIINSNIFKEKHQMSIDGGRQNQGEHQWERPVGTIVHGLQHKLCEVLH